jgi:hypothetical protein
MLLFCALLQVPYHLLLKEKAHLFFVNPVYSVESSVPDQDLQDP